MTTSSLTLLMITPGSKRAQPFIRDLMDVSVALEGLSRNAKIFTPDREGYLELFLDDAVATCPGDYILRIDDDERISPAMIEWLKSGVWRTYDNWSFPRANLWGDAQTMILTPPLWPDYQTRLATKAKSGGRTRIHQGSTWPEKRADVPIEHHAYLVNSREEREAKAARYEAIRPGAGTGHYLPFSVPEVLGDLALGDYPSRRPR